MSPIIGIDLGTTYSCVGVWRNNTVEIVPNHIGQRTTPSWVSFDPETAQKLIGVPARRNASSNAKNTVFDVKRLMGKLYTEIESDLDNYPYELVPDQNGRPLVKVQYNNESRTFKPEEISAMILGYLRDTAEQFLGEPVKEAVITVPAYFNDAQRQATKDAATIAGLTCLRIINEPTAACLCYGFERDNTDLNVLVFDFGGGTFDVSILNLDKGLFQVLATCGDSHLGGEDIDWSFAEFLADSEIGDFKARGIDLLQDGRRLNRLHLACEQAKRELSVTTQTEIVLESFYPDGTDFKYKITRTVFETLIQPILDKTLKPVKQVLSDAELEPEAIKEIVLVGGSTRIPRVQEMLSRFFNNRKLNKSVNPDEAVAYGATVQAAMLKETCETSKVKDLLLLDVTPLSLGIETSGGLMAKIIERNTNIPCQQSKMFTTAEDNQESVLVQVYEGERKFTRDCHRLGTFELGPLLEAPRGVPKIKVEFKIDSNGILAVTALDTNTGLVTEAKLTPESGRLTTEEIQAMIANAEKYKLTDERLQACLEEFQTFERYLYSVQQAINDAQINQALDDTERSFVNQYLINSFQWINDNREDNEITTETISQARQSVEYNLKPIINRLYNPTKAFCEKA